MTRSFNRLERVLDLEAKQGYQNKAVVGGIRQFATFWITQAREEAQEEADKALVEQVGEMLIGYDRLPGAEARAKAIQSLLHSLQIRQARVAPNQPAKPAKTAVPPRPPRESKEKHPEPTPKKPEPSAKRPEPPKREGKGQAKEPMPPKTSKRKEESQKTAVPAAVAELDITPVEKFIIEDAPIVTPPPIIGNPDPVGLAQSVTTLKGVGPSYAEKLSHLGVQTVWELLYLFPRRYDDYTLMKPIGRVAHGEQVTVIGTIWETRARRNRNNQVVVQSVISDGSGSIQATWYGQPWLAEKLRAGQQIVLSGKVEQFLGRPVFNSPEWEPVDLEPLRTRRIVPIYPLTEGLNSHRLREWMQTAVAQWVAKLPDPLPSSIRHRHNLLTLAHAIQQVHFPDSQEMLAKARRRLAFDELFLLQLGVQGQKRQWQGQPGLPLPVSPEVLAEFEAALPFPLTGAQKRVIGEIMADLASQQPMNRLLQGDVGAGKTVVAAAAMLTAVKTGAQAALMAPTEILAEQHFRGLSQLLTPMGIEMAVLTGRTSAAAKTAVYEGLASGHIQIVIGTHALIQESVQFQNLVLAVIDEQHRFGVDQRQALRQKGAKPIDVDSTAVGQPNPHILVMSATPIPRTLALSIYGDLSLSVLDEMPPGRQEIKTRWLRSSERERAYNFVRREVAQGRQAFIIYPLVEETEKVDAKAAVEEYTRLQEEIFPDLKLGLVHGRLRPNEKEEAMRAFYNGETHILVATSVIEVGVDVPNSTVMVIEGANRFGLAQLHQFRGRVGRGQHQSYCILIADSTSIESEERLQALEQSNDGFVLAEKDLELRGPGQFFGQRQSGIPELKMASLLDMTLVEKTREEAIALCQADPELEQPQHKYLREQVSHFWDNAADVS